MSSSNVERWRKDLDSYKNVKVPEIDDDIRSVVDGVTERLSWLRVLSRDTYGLNAIDDSYLTGVEETIQTIDEELKSIRSLSEYTRMPESEFTRTLDIGLRRELLLMRVFMNNTVIQLISLVQKKLADNQEIKMQGAKLKEILAEQDKISKERMRSYVV